MNRISAIDEGSHPLHEGSTVTDELEYGRHTAAVVRDPGDYHGRHHAEDAYLTNIA
jgi:hypothetical protein